MRFFFASIVPPKHFFEGSVAEQEDRPCHSKFIWKIGEFTMELNKRQHYIDQGGNCSPFIEPEFQFARPGISAFSLVSPLDHGMLYLHYTTPRLTEISFLYLADSLHEGRKNATGHAA